MLTILTLDPGISNLGWAKVQLDRNLASTPWVVSATGCIHAEPSQKGKLIAVENVRRAREAYRSLLNVCGADRIDCIVAELPSGGSKSAKACAAMAAATALIGALVETIGCPACLLLPSYTRKKLFNRREVHKKEVAKYVKQWFKSEIPLTGLQKHDEHILDALGAFISAVDWKEISELRDKELNGKLGSSGEGPVIATTAFDGAYKTFNVAGTKQGEN